VRELDSIAVVGAGRLGTALTTGLRAAGLSAAGPLGRSPDVSEASLVLLCVPDGQIAAAAAAIAAGRQGMLVGHCSGATTLEPLGDREAFSLHPLMTVPAGSPPGVFAGAAAAVEGSSPRALAAAEALAEHLGMRPMRVAPEDRAAYHAAASIASNFLVTLEAAAERLAATAGVDRAALAPLVRAAVDTWVELGGERALTGPIVRGDEATVERQRAALLERTPELAPLFDALADATRALARTGVAA
jgi:predicted short-subunit dehydrogenase-like oxidoreductase (DUF2520 family)